MTCRVSCFCFEYFDLFSDCFQLTSLETEKMELLELWEKRRVQFEQCMELQLFNRDCEHADATMTKQEV